MVLACWPKKLGLPCMSPGEPWEDAEPWADLHFGTPSLLQPGPGNAEMTIFIYSVYLLILFP